MCSSLLYPRARRKRRAAVGSCRTFLVTIAISDPRNLVGIIFDVDIIPEVRYNSHTMGANIAEVFPIAHAPR